MADVIDRHLVLLAALGLDSPPPGTTHRGRHPHCSSATSRACACAAGLAPDRREDGPAGQVKPREMKPPPPHASSRSARRGSRRSLRGIGLRRTTQHGRACHGQVGERRCRPAARSRSATSAPAARTLPSSVPLQPPRRVRPLPGLRRGRSARRGPDQCQRRVRDAVEPVRPSAGRSRSSRGSRG
jgi:hypothetical protein